MASSTYAKVNLQLRKITPTDLMVLGRNMVNCMSMNPAFPTPMPPLADVSEACDELGAAIEVWVINRGRLDKEERDSAFAKLKALLQGLAGYVQAVSGGDRTVVLSAGCAVRREATPLGELPAPMAVVARSTAYPGRIDLHWRGVRGRRLYRVLVSTDPNDPASWAELTYTGKNHHSVDELNSNTLYYFRVEAIGTSGRSPLSDVASAKAA